MSEPAVAKVFMTGRSQAVRLPKEYRFEGTEVRIHRVGAGVFIMPVCKNAVELFAALDAITGGKFDVEPPPDAPLEPEDIFGEAKA